MFAELASIVAPVYLIAGLGYGWARRSRHYDMPFITDLVMNIGAPCLLFASLSQLHMETSALAVTGQDTQAVLEGQTFDGLRIVGSDSVRVVQE